MSKNSSLRVPFNKQHGKCAQALLKSTPQQFYHIEQWLPGELSWIKSLLLICQILGLLVNTWPADNKDRVLNRENLMIPIRMQLSKQQKTFSEFLKSILNFEHFEKEDDPQRFCLLGIRESKKVVRKMSKKYRFKGQAKIWHCLLTHWMPMRAILFLRETI